MPDRHGFNLLGDSVRCIDCEAGGPLWRWPERKRRRHASRHRPLARGAGDRRRQRVLLATPPTATHEEKEATTMAKQTSKGEPAKQVAIDVLQTAGEPLHAKEIAKRVLESGRSSGLKGRTPEATISAMLAVGSKPGGPFKRVGKGTYTLADAATPPAEEAAAAKPEAKPRARKRQQEKPAA